MSEALQATTFTVTGMTCSGCARKVDAAVRDIQGVKDVSLHYPETTLGVLHVGAVSSAAITDVVTSLGFEILAA
jgi:copper chaperone CopZ